MLPATFRFLTDGHSVHLLLQKNDFLTLSGFTIQISVAIFMSTPFKGGRHIVLLRLASASALALASGLTLWHPLLNFFLGAPKYDPSYMEIIFHWCVVANHQSGCTQPTNQPYINTSIAGQIEPIICDVWMIFHINYWKGNENFDAWC